MKRTAFAAGLGNSLSIAKSSKGKGGGGSITFPSTTGVSQPIHDRSSIFQAFFVPLLRSDELPSFLTSFKASDLCVNADHVMTAFRIHDCEIGIETGFEDDGERYSGVKLENLLQSMDVFGLIICTRQFGGIMLGPIRFQHITQCARDAVMQHVHERSVVDNDTRKLKIILAARDKTILALRTIVQSKTNIKSTSPGLSDGPSSQSSDTTEQKYKDLSVTVLQRVLEARNRTIGALRTMAVAKESRNETGND